MEAVEPGAQAGAVGTELADLNPVALGDVFGQQERTAHHVRAVACRAEETKAAALFRRRRSVWTEAAYRVAKPERASVEQAAIHAIVDIKRVAAARLDLHHDRATGGHQRAARLRPKPDARQVKLFRPRIDFGENSSQPRRLDVRVGHRKSATDVDDI